ncbi:MAG: DUF5684 domain-containing protein [Actinomycetota bacterium]
MTQVSPGPSPADVARIFESFGPFIAIWTLAFVIGFGALMFWGILSKAGRPGWRSLIPVYQWGEVAAVAGKPAWWGWVIGLSQLLPSILMIFIFNSMFSWLSTQEPGTIPVGMPPGFQWFTIVWIVGLAGFVFTILVAIAVARAFGQRDAWAAGLVLLPIVFYPIIGLGSSVYVGPNAPRQSGLPPPPPPYPAPPPPPPPPA